MVMHVPKPLMAAAAAAIMACGLAGQLEARPFGKDSLSDPAAQIDEGNLDYRGIALLGCTRPDGTVAVSNGFLAGHPRLFIASRASLSLISDGAIPRCRVQFFAADGTLKDTVRVDRWLMPGTGDIQGLVLARASTYASSVPLARRGFDVRDLDGKAVLLVTLVRQGSAIVRKAASPGIAKPIGGAAARSTGVIMAVSYDSVSASRGSPVFDGAGNVAGIHGGSHCPSGNSFDPVRCYNEMLLIPPAVRARIAAEAEKLNQPANGRKSGARE